MIFSVGSEPIDRKQISGALLFDSACISSMFKMTASANCENVRKEISQLIALLIDKIAHWINFWWVSAILLQCIGTYNSIALTHCDNTCTIHWASRWCMYFTWTLYHTITSFNPFPNKPWFLHVCSIGLLKTLWEKEKLLETCNFSFYHSVF